MNSIYQKQINIRLLAIMSLTVMFFGIFCLLVPAQFDDLCFEAVYAENGGGTSFNLSAWWDFVKFIRANDVGRISNLPDPLATYIYPWRLLYPWITGIVCAIVLLLSARLAFGKSVGWRKYLIMCLTLAIALPMRNCIMVPAYALNYIYASLVNLALILLMLYILKHKSKSIFATISGIILAILAGGWHEGFAFPLIAGVGLISLMKWPRNISWWLILIVYIVAAFGFVLGSGTTTRASSEVGFKLHSVIIATIDSFMVPVACLALIVFWVKDKKIKISDLNPVFILFFTASLAAFALTLVVHHNSRVSFAPQLFASIALWSLLNKYKSNWIHKVLYNRAVIWIGVIFLGIVSITTLIWQYRFYKEYQEIMSKFESTGDTTIYHDIILPETVPAYTLFWPVRATWVERYHYECLAMKYGVNMAVVPKVLDTDINQNAIPVEGDAAVKSIEGVLVGPFELMETTDKIPLIRPMEFTYPDGKKLTHECLLMPFTDNKGITRVYIRPYNRLLQRLPKSQPVSINVI